MQSGGSNPSWGTKLKNFNFMWWFNKDVEYEDEKVPMPIIYTVIIAIALVVVLFFGTYKVVGWMEKADLKANGQTELIETFVE